jgi:hypothetical protein
LILVGATGRQDVAVLRADRPFAARASPRLHRASVLERPAAHGDGSFARKLAALACTDLLPPTIGQVNLTQNDRANLLGTRYRVNTRLTLITSQLTVDTWHEYLADPTLADAILDRLVHHSHRVALRGESMRKRESK